MIKASELRLGNLLMYDSNIFIVSSLSENNVIAARRAHNVGPGNSQTDYAFEYLPLSEELMMIVSDNETGYLTISSLERTSDSSDIIVLSTIECYLHEDGFLRVCAYEYDQQPDGSTNISDDVITLGYRHIRYAHQLQNLYFNLTGKELPIPVSLEKIP
jgi:hypothetical protein